MNYQTNCTEAEADDIENMIEHSTEISWKTFRKHVNLDDLKSLFPDYRMKRHDSGFIHISKDYSVSFHRGKFKGQNCIYFENSRIEYIFI